MSSILATDRCDLLAAGSSGPFAGDLKAAMVSRTAIDVACGIIMAENR
jgi:hypothetical protein